MQNAIDSLEYEFQKCSGELSQIARTLENEFEAHASSGVNPVRLLARIKAIQGALPGVKKEFERLTQAKQDIIVATRSLVASNESMIHVRTACDMAPPVEDHEQVVAAYKQIASKWEKENAAWADTRLRAEIDEDDLIAVDNVNFEMLCCAIDGEDDKLVRQKAGAGPHGAADDEEGGQGDAPSSPKPEAEADTNPHISEAEFMSVSNIIRGRSTVTEVNELMQVLINHVAKTGRNKAPLSTQQLMTIGAKVAGRTGGSRLATLRALKRITVTKEGVLLNKKWMPQ